MIDRINEGLRFVNLEMSKIVDFYDNCSKNIIKDIIKEKNKEYENILIKFTSIFDKLKKQKDRVLRIKEKCFLAEKDKGGRSRDTKLKKLRTQYENEHVG